MFALFTEGNLLSETHENEESVDKYDNNSITRPLISEEEIETMGSGDEYEDEHMYIEMLEDIRDIIQSFPSVNRIEAR